MDINNILYPILSIGGMGVLFGIGLGIAAIKFKVEQDPKIPLIRDALPGANCGGCGFPGCDALAEAIANGDAKVTACPVGGENCAQNIAEIMGVEVGSTTKTTAFVKCKGDCDSASNKFDYYGVEDCSIEAALAGGKKNCVYGCLGGGNCVRACQFDALSIANGIAVVNTDKCVSCGACVSACPKQLIEIIPLDAKVKVVCNSHDNPKTTKTNCSVGCIGCSICAKNCPNEAIQMDKFLAKVDYSKCTGCGICVEKCPTKVIS